MAINVNVQYNGGLLPDIILLTQCYLDRGTRLNAMKRFCIYLQPLIPPKRFDIFFPPNRGMLRRSANEKGGGTDLTWRWPISSLYSTWRPTSRPF